MRPFRSSVLLALFLGACAPAAGGGVIAPPAPAPAPVSPPAAPPAEPAPAPEPDEALVTAPERWWHLDRAEDRIFGISADRAYEQLLAGRQPARSVVVAIIDSGVDIEHEDLDDNLWVNEGEIPGNGVDDDGNGYVDDVHGWNFIGGPDGQQVDKDTYEVARLVAVCREGAAGSGLSYTADECRDLEAELAHERQETQSLLRQMQQLSTVLSQVETVLEQHLGTDSLTAERVAAIAPDNADLWRAQQVYMQFAANGITGAVIEEQRQMLQGKLEYGLNPEFDPRGIVGDDYSDPRERFYGNAEVEGPDARHGTHVAGIVAAERDNGVGVDGIAPAVRIMVLRAVPDGDERDKDVANAIRYAADNGAHIINMSFGKGHSPYKEVVDEAVRHAVEQGVLLVHAAGNEGVDVDETPSYPTRYYADGGVADTWIEVGASSWEGEEGLAASFSNYSAKTVDVFAPGVEILSTVPGNEYERLQGTSMAAPVVSGLAALLMAYYPDLSAAQVKQVILESSTQLAEQVVARPGTPGSRARFGDLSVTGGIVNVYAALQMAEQLSGR